MNAITHIIGNLRDIEDSELETILSWRNEPNVRVNMYTQHEISLSEHLIWWDSIKNREDNKYFIYEHQEKPLGVVYFTGIDVKNKNSAWGFYASPSAPKGTGSKMEYLALEYSFNIMEIHKLFCEVMAFNTQVIKLHKKFGFQVEGLLREQKLINDDFVDVYQLGIIASEWQCHREEMLSKLIKLSNS